MEYNILNRAKSYGQCKVTKSGYPVTNFDDLIDRRRFHILRDSGNYYTNLLKRCRFRFDSLRTIRMASYHNGFIPISDMVSYNTEVESIWYHYVTTGAEEQTKPISHYRNIYGCNDEEHGKSSKNLKDILHFIILNKER